MPDITKVNLLRYRFRKAEEILASDRRDMQAKDYASANNRAYYAIFHAIRAVLALDGEDFKKHSSVIALFTLNYLKPEILSREYSKLISNASLIRSRSDQEDFYICSVLDTNALLSGAVTFYKDVSEYLEQRYRTELQIYGLTHTMTYAPKCPERDRECQTGSFTFLPGFFDFFIPPAT